MDHHKELQGTLTFVFLTLKLYLLPVAIATVYGKPYPLLRSQ